MALSKEEKAKITAGLKLAKAEEKRLAAEIARLEKEPKTGPGATSRRHQLRTAIMRHTSLVGIFDAAGNHKEGCEGKIARAEARLKG
jgi:hypothetical protein